MGAVYKGWQKSLDRFVAIKILPPQLEDGEGNFAERFQREAKAMARFAHPGIVSVYDAGETPEGLLYFIMEYVEGTDVQKLVAAEKRLSPAHALGITVRVCDALAYAHRRGVIHRDIKPSNIMVDADGQVKIADFGLVKVIDNDSALLTGTHLSMGTPDFMAPETMLGMGKVDQRADLYAVGVMLYQMLTGQLPRGRFEPPSVKTPGLDMRFDAIIDRALQTDPEKRYSTATEIRTDLDRIITEPFSGGIVVPPRSKSAGFSDATPTVPLSVRERWGKAWIFGAVALAALFLVAGWAILKQTQTRPASAPTNTGPTSNPTERAATPFTGRTWIADRSPSASSEPPQTQTVTAIPTALPTPVSQTAVAAKPTNRFEELLLQGKELRERGDLNAALAKFREAGVLDAQSPIPLAELAATYDKMGLADKASEHWRKVYALGESAGIYYSLAEAKLKGTQEITHRDSTGSTSPGAADTSGAIEGIAAGATLGLLRITREEQPDADAALHFVLHIPIEARPGVHVDVHDLVIHVLFYDILNGRDVVQTSAKVSNRWVTPPADWSKSDTEELAVEYQLPKPGAWGTNGGNRKYFGYIVRIYYKQKLQASAANPERLGQEYPAPDTLPTESSETQTAKMRESAATASAPPAKADEILTSPDYEWSQPENLGPGVNSTKDEYALGISDDGLALVVSSTRVGDRHLFECRRRSVDEPFGPATLIKELTATGLGSAPFLSADGLTLLYASPHPGHRLRSDIYESDRNSRGKPWEKPVPVALPASTSYDTGPCLSADGRTLWFTSNRAGGRGGFDLWQAHRSSSSDRFNEPVNLGAGVNTDADEFWPRTIRDQRAFLFHRERHGNGQQLFLAVADVNGVFTSQPLPLPVNGGVQSPMLSSDGLILYFASDMAGGQGGWDIWQIRRVPKAGVAPRQ